MARLESGAGMTDDRDDRKREAALAAVAMVEDGMVVGLGTGSTAAFAIDGLIDRVRGGLRIVGIPTSERSASQARKGGIEVTDFGHHTTLDLTIDGADEIARDTLDLVKGRGGALLREKIVAAASVRLVIIADEPKLLSGLGATVPVPVEVVSFGWETTALRLAKIGGRPVLRKGADGAIFHTDGGNLILDCDFGAIADPAALEAGFIWHGRGGRNGTVHRNGHYGSGGDVRGDHQAGSPLVAVTANQKIK